MLPPHGYIKMKTWINVPDQVPTDGAIENSPLTMLDNANVYGSWVLHCHILRHEDRGMMSMVNTVPNPVVLGPATAPALAWYDSQTDAAAQYNVFDHHGSLSVHREGADPKTDFKGTFTQGLGNPFITQPFAGAMNFPTKPATFCVTDDAKLIMFSNGSQWVTTKNPPAYPAPNNVYVDLTGTWTDDSANQATIKQTKLSQPGSNPMTTTISGDLVVTPIANPSRESVWWNIATGTWNAGQGTQDASGKTTTANVNYGGKLVHRQIEKNDGKDKVQRNQVLSFAVSTDGKTIVFSNGVKWTKNP